MKFAEKFLVQLATFFGVGKTSKAPGTWGTLACVPLALVLNYLGPFWAMGVTVLMLPVAILSAEIYEKQNGDHDAKEVVIDEVLGFLITMTWLPISWQCYVLGFFLFRFLDILKPFPIGYIDKKVRGGLGVVADDVVAGIIANIVLQVIYTKTTWLGSQIVTAGFFQ